MEKLDEADSRAEYQETLQPDVCGDQQLQVVLGQSHMLHLRHQAMKHPVLCMLFRNRLAKFAPTTHKATQTDAWRRTWAKELSDALQSHRGVLWELMQANPAILSDHRRLMECGLDFYGVLSKPIHELAPANPAWSDIDDIMWKPEEAVILKFLEAKLGR